MNPKINFRVHAKPSLDKNPDAEDEFSPHPQTRNGPELQQQEIRTSGLCMRILLFTTCQVRINAL